MINKKNMACSIGQMGENMMACGRMGNSMAKVKIDLASTLKPQVKPEQEFGRMARRKQLARP